MHHGENFGKIGPRIWRRQDQGHCEPGWQGLIEENRRHTPAFLKTNKRDCRTTSKFEQKFTANLSSKLLFQDKHGLASQITRFDVSPTKHWQLGRLLPRFSH